jgi:hypothetical protein
MESGVLDACAAVGSGASSLAICPARPVLIAVVGLGCESCDGDAVVPSTAPCSLADQVGLAPAMFCRRSATPTTRPNALQMQSSGQEDPSVHPGSEVQMSLPLPQKRQRDGTGRNEISGVGAPRRYPPCSIDSPSSLCERKSDSRPFLITFLLSCHILRLLYRPYPCAPCWDAEPSRGAQPSLGGCRRSLGSGPGGRCATSLLLPHQRRPWTLLGIRLLALAAAQDFYQTYRACHDRCT